PAGNYQIAVTYSGDSNFDGNVGHSSISVWTTPNNLYVDNLYLLQLNRAAMEPAAKGWVDQLNAGTSPDKVVKGITNSDEYRNNLVTKMYELYLNRLPDPVGLANWTKLLANGAAVEQVEAGIVGSQEHFGLKGTNNTSFVQDLYFELLDRAATPA